MRTQKNETATKHLRNSREVFLRLLEISREMDDSIIDNFIKERDYEELDQYIINCLIK